MGDGAAIPEVRGRLVRARVRGWCVVGVVTMKLGLTKEALYHARKKGFITF